MGVREKLVELLRNSPHFDTVKGYKGNDCTFEQGADWLIAHGVTVQEWINADDRVPDEPMRCLVYTKRGKYWDYEITYYNQGFYTQYAETIYWMPLPPAPEDMK